MSEELELIIVYNHDKSVRCIYLDDHRICGGKPYVSEYLPQVSMKVKTADIVGIASRHAAKVEEPLAVVAHRKNYWIDTYQNRILSFRIRATEYRQIVAHQVTEPKEFRGKTYAEAEAKARQYLNTLKGKGEKI